jgi:hypothetical protein
LLVPGLAQGVADLLVATVYELGWPSLANGQLLAAAEQAGYELLITTDQNLRYQQNLAGRSLSYLLASYSRTDRGD